jgi:phosphatidate cytidylyltransferase
MTSTRVLTAVVLIPIVLGTLAGPAWLTAALVCAVIVLSLREFFALGSMVEFHGFRKWTMLCTLFLVLLQYDASLRDFAPRYVPPRIFGFEIPIEVSLGVFVMGTGILTVANRRGVQERVRSIAISTCGMVCIAFPLSYLVRLRGENDAWRLLVVLLMVWVGDAAGYFVGRAWGKHPLAPVISPKKTWEGAIANVCGAWLVVALWFGLGALANDAAANKKETGLIIAVFFGLATVVSIAGQAGDLFESAFKRSTGAKDSGSILPGHGGMLDRIDALIFAAPAAWYYLMIFKGL